MACARIVRPLLQLLLATLLVSTLFSYSGQLSCKCGCGKNNMSQRFLDELEDLESAVNIEFQINSGSRCSSYNRQNGGSSSSLHLQGLSVDISDLGWTDRQRKKLIKRARRSRYFTKVLTYHDSNHIHIEANPYSGDFVHHKIYKDSSNRYAALDGNYYLGMIQNLQQNQSVRLGYFDSINERNNIAFFFDKLIRKGDDSDIYNHMSLGIGWSRNIQSRHDHYGLNISMGIGEYGSTYYLYYEPAISIGSIFKYMDLWLNIGYILPVNSTTNVHSYVPGPTITLNANIGYFNLIK